MHVTVVGAGVLGQIYGVRLAAAGEQVAFVVRPERSGEASPFVLEQVNGPRRRDALDGPQRVTRIPGSTGAVLLAVRFDQLSGGAPLLEILREAPSVPLIAITPMLPGPRAAVEAALGRRLTAAMPGAAGYLDERGVVRYWLSALAPTLVDGDAVGGDAPVVDQLLHRLGKAGLPAHRERDVGALNAATTTAFFPLVAAIDAGGGVDGVLADRELLATVIDAARESDALGQKLGKVASWAYLLTRFVGPYTLKPAVTLARRLAPETLRFAESHFGPKLHAQHLAMGEAILALGRDLGLPTPALTRLVEVLRSRAAEPLP
jgi:2-dehydropantoate 2-reductase